MLSEFTIGSDSVIKHRYQRSSLNFAQHGVSITDLDLL